MFYFYQANTNNGAYVYSQFFQKHYSDLDQIAPVVLNGHELEIQLDKCIFLWHGNYGNHFQAGLNWVKKYNFEKIACICSNKLAMDNLKKENIPNLKAFYLPIAVERTNLPVPKRLDRILYVGYSYKPIDLNGLDQFDLPVDMIINNTYNGRTLYSHRDVLEIMNSYNYGAGEGQVFREFAQMGVKPIICGACIGKLLTCEKDYIEAEKYNFIPVNEYESGNVRDIFIMPPEFFTDKTKEYLKIRKEIENFINSK
ncbi:MAG: hypothetical protein PHE32_03940 [Candidatus Shapirobacteria bacterium]|nr:hypothetical protein [Candidatus Shapirobacteria bacterium]